MLGRATPTLLLLLAGCATVPQTPAPGAGNYAWASFDRGGITASGAEGLADRAANRPLTIDDPVRIASISKLIVALGVMRLVEQGKLDLDGDVSDPLGWRLRNPAFPERPISLRLLLSHRSSLTDDAEYVIPLGGTAEAWVQQPRVFDAEHPPGTYFRYSNLNFPVIATAMERATGERFDLLMQRLVLSPLRLSACFNWTTCDEAAVARAVVLYSPEGEAVRDDLKGERPACPVAPAAGGSCDWQAYRPGTNGGLFSPQGGLRISIADLARIGRLLLRDGRLEDGTPFLSPTSLLELTRPGWRFDGGNGETDSGFYCGYGLAVQTLAQCPPGDDPFGDGRARIGHAGEAYGLRSGLWVDPKSGTGIAYFATGVAEDAPRGRSAFRAVEEWLAAKAR